MQKKNGVVIKYIQTNTIKSFKDVWKPYNKLLSLTDTDVDFVTLFSDEFRFATQEWDNILKKQTGPASREDYSVLKKHEEMLKYDTKEIYKVLSESIIKSMKSK